LIHSFIHFWQAPLVVHSTKCRHQSPEWTILSQPHRLPQSGRVYWISGPVGQSSST